MGVLRNYKEQMENLSTGYTWDEAPEKSKKGSITSI